MIRPLSNPTAPDSSPTTRATTTTPPSTPPPPPPPFSPWLGGWSGSSHAGVSFRFLFSLFFFSLGAFQLCWEFLARSRAHCRLKPQRLASLAQKPTTMHEQAWLGQWRKVPKVELTRGISRRSERRTGTRRRRGTSISTGNKNVEHSTHTGSEERKEGGGYGGGGVRVGRGGGNNSSSSRRSRIRSRGTAHRGTLSLLGGLERSSDQNHGQ